MKVYLAGKITGDPNYREKFAEAAKKLEERAGVTVISPAVTPEGLKKADYVRGYSWAKISARMGTADSTARDWHTRAMERLGEVLEELPEAEALARRASRART